MLYKNLTQKLKKRVLKDIYISYEGILPVIKPKNMPRIKLRTLTISLISKNVAKKKNEFFINLSGINEADPIHL